jgi:hypothetical protein
MFLWFLFLLRGPKKISSLFFGLSGSAIDAGGSWTQQFFFSQKTWFSSTIQSVVTCETKTFFGFFLGFGIQWARGFSSKPVHFDFSVWKKLPVNG